jgi:hypothetical protein
MDRHRHQFPAHGHHGPVKGDQTAAWKVEFRQQCWQHLQDSRQDMINRLRGVTHVMDTEDQPSETEMELQRRFIQDTVQQQYDEWLQTRQLPNGTPMQLDVAEMSGDLRQQLGPSYWHHP